MHILSLLLWIIGYFGVILGSLGYITWYFTETWWLSIILPIVLLLLYNRLKAQIYARKVAMWQDTLGPEAPILEQDGITFRDLNKNGKLDIYEDPRAPIEERVEDLLSQMNIDEKAGLMFSPMMNAGGKIGEINDKKGMMDKYTLSDVIIARKISTFATMGSISPTAFVRWHNNFQKMAECTRLGIPVTLCSDPRHEHLEESNVLATLLDASLSKWPQPPGLAATRDPKLVENFGDIARKELTALGIRFALHPMADLATEPRWGRISGTFGEDAELSSQMVAAYIRGFQTEKIGRYSVACCVKHFPGGGPQRDGLDPHSAIGADQIYPGDNYEYHKKSFAAAFEAGAAAVMPYYAKPVGVSGLEEVGFNFNHQVTTEQLREEMGFKGVVHTDYNIITGMKMFLRTLIGPMAWGVEHLKPIARVEKAINAGIDQIGGEALPDLVVELVKQGRIDEKRIDESCRRVLRLKFELGLFDHPYLDEKHAKETCNHPDFIAAGEEAMRKSLVLLKNGNDQPILPLQGPFNFYIEGFDPDIVIKYGKLVDKPEDADFALLNLKAPKRTTLTDIFTLMFSNGDLDFTSKQKKKLEKIMRTCPTIVNIYLDRPAIIPELKEHATAIIANFSVKQEIVMDMIFGKFGPSGKLPFELPRSMEAVKNQKPDLPYDSDEPCYPFGHGLEYS